MIATPEKATPHGAAASSPSAVHRPLRIGVDARSATDDPAGKGRVMRELLRALAARDEQQAYVLYARARWGEELDERFHWRLLSLPGAAWHLAVGRKASRECDVFLANSYLTPPLMRIPSVALVHDLLAFDRTVRPSLRSTAIERLSLSSTVRRATSLLAVSQTTADQLVARFPRAAGKVTVMPLGATYPSSVSESVPPDLRDGFVLAVGTVGPRKNLERLAAAYARLPYELKQRHQLVVAGARGSDVGGSRARASDRTLQALERLGERCRYLGWVPDEELTALYRHCAVFCYLSLGEGFGLPLLEAMQAGAAVLSSDRPSLPEVGGDAVHYVDPTDVVEISTALESLLRSPERRSALSAMGQRRASMFTWSRSAESALNAVYGAAAA